MRRAILKEHKDYFQANGSIEFAEIVPVGTLNQLKVSIDETLAKRLELSQEDLARESPSRLFTAGRDMWRALPAMRSIVTQGVLAEIAAILLGQSCLRLGYDQLLFSPRFPPYTTSAKEMQFWQRSYTLPQISSIEGVVGGWLICIQDDDREVSNSSLFPTKIGCGVVFSSVVPISLQQLKDLPNHRYLLVVYTRERASYIDNPGDPNVKALRKLGYRFGHLLVDKWNPIVYRSSAYGLVHP